MTYKLMLKIHRVTYMKYLCVTRKENYKKYTGSGIYWCQHLSKYGTNIKTILLYESDTKDENFINKCLYFSNKWNIIDNNEFANLIIENGNSSWINEKKHHDLNHKSHMKNIMLNYYNNTPEGMNTRFRLSKKLKEYYNTPEGMNTKIRISQKIKDSFDLNKRQYYSKLQKDNWINNREKISKSISIGRKKMTIEAKNKRSENIAKSFAKSNKRKKFVDSMKILRLGKNNPNAVTVYWDNLIFDTLTNFYEYLKTQNISKNSAKKYLNDPNIKTRYMIGNIIQKQLACPHCNKIGRGSGMKKWHFDNCKEKK